LFICESSALNVNVNVITLNVYFVMLNVIICWREIACYFVMM